MSRPKPKSGSRTAKAAALTAFAEAASAAGLTSQPGKEAVEGQYRAGITARSDRARFTGSVDLDASFKRAEPTSNRWDYGVGLHDGAGEFAVWIEPHPASSTGEVKKVLAKLDWLQAKLAQPDFEQLKALTEECVRQGHRPYHWMATAHVAIRPGSREANMLAVRGMNLTANRVTI